MTYHARTTDPTETEDLAQNIGQRLRGGEVIELQSDLGGGKTTFVRGLARGFGSSDKVSSPTFTLSKVYASGQKQLHHFDFYRLHDAGIMAHELHDLLADPDIVVAVEWAEAVSHVLPPERLKIKIISSGDDQRDIEIEYPEKLKYLIETKED